ncbi:MAG: FTR1 family protein [Paenisporosarcina sp.]|nr:FTR1 family protein [Paenisporosarcina sp.]
MKSLARFIILFVLLSGLFPAKSFAATPQTDLTRANVQIDEILQQIQEGDTKNAQNQYKEYVTNWIVIEEGVKKESEQAYRDIEDWMGRVQFSFAQSPINEEAVQTNLQELKATNLKFIEGGFTDATPTNPSSKKDRSDIATLILVLNQAIDEIEQNDAKNALLHIEEFRQSWLDIEGVVLTQSAKVYQSTEKDMVTSYAMLAAKNPDFQGAKKTLESMKNDLAPLASKTSYTMLDATTILLREGLEALLVVIALMGYLKKSGHADKNKWIWGGVGTGIGISILLGIAVNLLFVSGTFGQNNFLIAGWTGVFAAVMLLYMSYWLHSKSSISEWNKYIRTQSTKALATGSLFSLATLAFLAVFREGTETVLFFIGMASSIELASLVGGVLIGLALLAIISYLLLKVGMKIPIRPFFMVSSVLMFYLCLKFTGMGIHGLQLAGFIPATQAPIYPIDFLAIYATWESFIPQLILVIVALIIFLWKNKPNKLLSSRIKRQEEINNEI